MRASNSFFNVAISLICLYFYFCLLGFKLRFIQLFTCMSLNCMHSVHYLYVLNCISFSYLLISLVTFVFDMSSSQPIVPVSYQPTHHVFNATARSSRSLNLIEFLLILGHPRSVCWRHMCPIWCGMLLR